jgi:hypothetical protein
MRANMPVITMAIHATDKVTACRCTGEVNFIVSSNASIPTGIRMTAMISVLVRPNHSTATDNVTQLTANLQARA